MRLTLTLLFICILQATAQKYTISGYIKDAHNGENLIGANVYETRHQSGSSANTYGFYSLTLPADSVQLLYSFVGYATQAVSFELRKDTTIHIELTDNALLKEVVISGRQADKIQEVTQMSSISVPIEQIKSLPALLGEVDVLKIIQLLPGVQSGNEGSSGLYVRGGGPDQNLILLDGVPVYNASHLFGFFSVFNADAVNQVQLIKGGFPARYGGRLSSVIDISMKEGNSKEFHGTGSVGLVAARLTLEGPIISEKTSFIVSGRRTYIDLLTRPLLRAQTGGNERAGYFFYDLNAKVNHKFSNSDRLYLSSYFGDDEFYARYREEETVEEQTLRYRSDSGLQWGNFTAALRWNHMFSSKLFSNLTLTHSRYRFAIFSETENDYLEGNQKITEFSRGVYFSGIQDQAARIDFDYIPSPRHYVRFGLNAIRHTFNPGAFNVKAREAATAMDTTLGSAITRAVEYAAYVEDDLEISHRLKVNIGLHLTGFYVNERFYRSLQPRIAARYLAGEHFSVKASYARMAQFIHLLTNSGIGLPTDLWVPATDIIPPQRAHQVALGLARDFQNRYEVSMEGYFKKMDNLIEYKEGASFIATGSDWQHKVAVGSGQSYGSELLIQKKEGRTTGWLGYTLSWSNRQFDELNMGKRFPYKYDRRHDLELAVVHAWREKIDFSFSWVFGTGNAITLPLAIYAGDDNTAIPVFGPNPEENFFPPTLYHYGERNSYRMKAYHRLDMNIAFKKKTRWGERSWTVGVYNAYSRKNPFYIYLDEGAYMVEGYQQQSRFKQVSLFPIIPSVSYNFKF